MNSGLESFLDEAKKYITPAKETTIFALGGRSYYENAASDLLAFFLKPDAEHGLEDLFLSTFLECMGEGRRQLDMGHVDIAREVPTVEQNRPDLTVLGQDWCLIIENKIYHGPLNPFWDYEAHAKHFRKNTNLFSILSPNGILPPKGSASPGCWKPVSYKNYFQKLRDRMAAKFFDVPLSKWHIFAREFILHIENELYNPPMNHDEATFVEEHAAELIQVQKLLKQYLVYLCSVVKERIEKEVHYEIEVIPNWAIIIKSPKHWGNAHIALWYQKNENGGPTGISADGFYIRVHPDEGELKRGQSNADQSNLLRGMKYLSKEYCWVTEKSFKSHDEAIKFIIPLIKLIEPQPAC